MAASLKLLPGSTVRWRGRRYLIVDYESLDAIIARQPRKQLGPLADHNRVREHQGAPRQISLSKLFANSIATFADISGTDKCVYLYRAVDSTGATIDFLPSSKRDAAAAEPFLAKGTSQII